LDESNISNLGVEEIAEFIEGLAPGPAADEGFKFGDPQAQVKGVLVCWMATLAALRHAVAEDCNLVICHEEMHYPYAAQHPGLEKYLTWTVNRRRISWLAEHNIVVYRAHGMLDDFCILDDFGRLLGLGEPVVSEGFFRIYDISPRPVAQLANEVKRCMGMNYLRVCGDVDRIVQRPGPLWGGLGLSVNVGFIEGLLRYYPDVLIAGESDEYAMFYAIDADIPLIETSHAASENYGLRHFAQYLAANFPGLKVVFDECPVPWEAH